MDTNVTNCSFELFGIPFCVDAREPFSSEGTNNRSLAVSVVRCLLRVINGANDPIRTDDLLITSELLYQLSYVGVDPR